jgi:hypothetical protein
MIIYTIIETDVHARQGRIIGLSRSSANAINIAEAHYQEAKKPIIVIRSNKSIFELGIKTDTKTALTKEERAIIKQALLDYHMPPKKEKNHVQPIRKSKAHKRRVRQSRARR